MKSSVAHLLDRGVVPVLDSLRLHPSAGELLAHACAVRGLQGAVLGLREDQVPNGRRVLAVVIPR